MILRSYYCILSYTLLCNKIGILKNYDFWGKFVNLKLWLCKASDILPVCKESLLPIGLTRLVVAGALITIVWGERVEDSVS